MLQCLFVVLVGFQHLCGICAAVWVIHRRPWISHHSAFNLLPFVSPAVTTFNINLGKTFYLTLLGRFIRLALSSTCALSQKKGGNISEWKCFHVYVRCFIQPLLCDLQSWLQEVIVNTWRTQVFYINTFLAHQNELSLCVSVHRNKEWYITVIAQPDA